MTKRNRKQLAQPTSVNGTNGHATGSITPVRVNTGAARQSPRLIKGRVKTALAASRVEEPRSIPILVREIEKDYQFLLAKLVINSIIQSARVMVECESDDPRAKALSENLMQRWNDSLPYSLECQGFGRVAFHQCREFDPATRLLKLTHLDTLPFDQTKMRLSPTGDFDGVDLEVKGESEPIEIQASESWWCALDATPKEPHGKSRYIGAPYEVWRERRKLDKNDELFLDRYALGTEVLYAPEEYEPNRKQKGDYGEVNTSGEPADPMADGQKAITHKRSGGSIVLSSRVYDGTSIPMWRLEPPQSYQNTTPLENKRRILDAAALRSRGVPERAVTQDEATGSYAMAQVHWQVLLNTCGGILGQIAASYQCQVIDTANALNFAPATRPTIKLVWELPDPAVVGLVVELVKAIVTNPAPSPLVTEGIVDLRKLLEHARLPAGDDIDEKLKAIAERLAAQVPGMLPVAGAASPGSPLLDLPTIDQPTDTAPIAPVDDVAATALNGAQITSLLEIVTQAAGGQLPLASVKPILQAAFPMIDQAVLDKIIKPIIGFEPQPPSASMAQRRPSLNAPDQVDEHTWEDIANQAAAKALEARQALLDALDDPHGINRGRL